MKQRKVFLGVSIPRDVAKRLARRMEAWQDLPIRLSKEDNLHVTVLFLGHVLDESVARICEQVETVCAMTQAFDLDFTIIEAVPEQGILAQQVEYSGEPSDELKRLREALEKELGMFSAEKKTFRPHITLGRMRKHAWQALEMPPRIEESFRMAVPVDSVIVYESTFQKGKGLTYEVLAECPLVY